MNFTFLGHSTFMLEISGKKFLVDPFITPNPQASLIDINTLNPDYILVSHAHGDHIADVVAISQLSGATVVSNPEICHWFKEKGVEKLIEMNFGGTLHLGEANVKYVPAVHSSAFPDVTYGGNPGGFVIYNNEKCLYFTGDTSISNEFKLIAEDFKVDVVVLPIGGHYTMDYKEASKVTEFVGTKHAFGVHFNTFPPISINIDEAKTYFKNKGLSLHTLNVGESTQF